MERREPARLFLAVFAEDDLEFLPPLLGYRDQFPLDLWGEVAKDRFVGRVDAESRANEKEARRERRDFNAAKVAGAIEGRHHAAGGAVGAVVVEGADADPVIERLKGKVQVFVGLQLHHHQSARVVEGEQVEHAAVAAAEGWHLRVDEIVAEAGKHVGHADPQARLEPALWLQAEERIGVQAVGTAAVKEAREQIAA